MRQARRSLGLVVTAIMMLMALLSGCTSKKQETTKNEETGKAFEFTLYAYNRDRPYNTVKDKLAEAIQQELGRHGVKVNLKVLPWAEYLDAVRKKGEGDAFLLGWVGDNGDVDNFLYTFFHSSQIDGGMNNMGYKNDRVDTLLKDAQATVDPKKRAQYYLDAEKAISEDAVWIPISHAKDYMATTAKVKGLQIHPTGFLDLRHVEVGDKKELIFGRGGDSVQLDPALIEDSASSQVVEQIFEALYTYKPGGTDVVPLLAKDMPRISEDGKVYTIELKQGITFHDGTPFNAEAVKFSIERLLKGDKKAMPYSDFTFGAVEKVEAKDPLTVVITLKQPVAPFLANLAMGLAAPIVSPTAVQKYGEKFAENPVGTGPFLFDSWTKDQQIVVKKNPNYWDRANAPKVDRVIFKVVKEANLRAEAVLKGEVDAIDGISPADVKRLEEGAKLISADGMNISYMGFRVDRPPFDKKELRQAVSMLIDKEPLVKGLYGSTATMAYTYVPPVMQKAMEKVMAGNPQYETSSSVPAVGMSLDYNPDQAKEMLKKLGYTVK